MKKQRKKNPTHYIEANEQIERLIFTFNLLEPTAAESLYNLIQSTVCNNLDKIIASDSILKY